MRAFFLLLLCLPLAGKGQTRTIIFQLPKTLFAPLASRYSSLEVLDLRADTTNMGTVQTGALQGGRKTPIVTEGSLSGNIEQFFQRLRSPNADTGHLLLSLRRFTFEERAHPNYNTGKVTLQAALFAEESAGKYRLLDQIDSTIKFDYRGEETDKLLNGGTDLFADFLSRSLTQLPAGEDLYSKANLLNTDSLIKTDLPLFKAEILAEGLYDTYTSFAKQLPDHQVKAQAGNGIVMNVKIVGENSSGKVDFQKVYALVHKGVPYIATEFGYYKLKKVGTDWIFAGRSREIARQGDMLAGGILGGFVGVAMVSENTTATYEMRLDPVDGRFIRLRKMK